MGRDRRALGETPGPPAFGKEGPNRPCETVLRRPAPAEGSASFSWVLGRLIKEESSMRKRKIGFALMGLMALLATAWLGVPASASQVLRMATTTSTEATGLLDVIAREFRADTGIDLQWVAVGTGKALEYGRRGDVDVVWVHDPEQEERFQAEGHGVNRRRTMYNDFVIVGPSWDPAKVRDAKSAREAFGRIQMSGSVFVSRADRSGTHMAELRLWGKVPTRQDRWYLESGQGMMETLLMAQEKGGYTLTDRATFTKYLEKAPKGLEILFEGDGVLRNQYSLMAVNPARHDNVRYHLAVKFINWVCSRRGQSLIGDFKISGRQIFFPNAQGGGTQ